MSDGSGSNNGSSEEVQTPTDGESVNYDSSSMDTRLENGTPQQQDLSIKIPIVGYEVMEQRAKFTVCLNSII